MSLLKNWFGPSTEAIWRKLCDELGAEFVDGGAWKSDKVRVTHGEWTLTLDTYLLHTGKVAVPFTRLRAPYVNPDRFRFAISRRGLLSGLAELLGAQDIEVGHRDFDRDFVLKGTSAAKLKLLLEDEELRRLISAQPELQLTVKDDEGWFGPEFPPGTDELVLQVIGVVRDPDRLKGMFALFSRLLDGLCRIGSAYAQAPRIEL